MKKGWSWEVQKRERLHSTKLLHPRLHFAIHIRSRYWKCGGNGLILISHVRPLSSACCCGQVANCDRGGTPVQRPAPSFPPAHQGVGPGSFPRGPERRCEAIKILRSFGSDSETEVGTSQVSHPRWPAMHLDWPAVNSNWPRCQA
ncbi:hypothetical protein E2C01_082805 [Portunus trituberculatus]|uniref:Uncharacterized protein n=1 Tax=Portunus trituberculatus TaxID=210409 RepID=A0A5B7IVI5_PORTR|nr:hypothetical protein [Portunus trituberculatus]